MFLLKSLFLNFKDNMGTSNTNKETHQQCKAR